MKRLALARRRSSAIGIVLLLFGFDTADAAQPQSLFNDEIRSLLAERCFACHGPDDQEAGLRLDTAEAATAELDSGAKAIVPGDLASSELLVRVMSDDESLRMPPDGPPLSKQQIDGLRRWIEAGATYDQHWAYTPLIDDPPPESASSSWVRSPIDAFVLAKLQEKQIAPSPQADRRTLIRRAYYDLIGLPPESADVEAFASDPDPNAFEKQIDQLLDSQHFGERWGRHWLDKARYADSDGYEKDRPRPNAWKYRDWVIDAINRDLPMDQFTVEQLAGDLLPDATDDQRLATAFHRQTLTNTEGGVDQEEFRVEAVFDRTETTGTIWLGLTVGCARCHTHKYDAITQDEYYRLFAFFNNGDESTIKLPKDEAGMRKYVADKASHDQKVSDLNQQLELAGQESAEAFDAWLRSTAERLAELKPLVLHDIKFEKASATIDGVDFEQQEDGGFLVTGTTPNEPVDYVIEAMVAGSPESEDQQSAERVTRIDQPITGIRLDVIADKRLPSSGPGRTPHGNFVLSEIEVAVDEKNRQLAGARHRSLRKISRHRKRSMATCPMAGRFRRKWAKANMQHFNFRNLSRRSMRRG
ncbi:MAG: DUF1549 domain-containing protein [Pirellulaceae bacterium]